jgi:sporulation protein YlmC with PRC-barrel domain
METRENLSNLHGLPVIAFEEGVQLGKVQDIYFDRQTKRIQGIAFKGGLWRREKAAYIDAAEILKVGRDVVIVSRQAAETPLPDPGADVSLRHLKGLKATTHEGAHIGEVVDLNVNHEDGTITAIILDDNRLLPVDAGDIVIGPDVVLVPAGYVARIRPLEEKTTGMPTATFDPAAVSDSIRHKYQEIKASVSSAGSTDKVFETLRSGSEKTRATFRRTSRKLQETLAQMRSKNERADDAADGEDPADQGAETEHADRTYFETEAGQSSPQKYPGSDADYAADAGRVVKADEKEK